ncbi:MAG: hypothetical protein WCD69_10995, partial [Xanthobacteraceae bacterium]
SKAAGHWHYRRLCLTVKSCGLFIRPIENIRLLERLDNAAQRHRRIAANMAGGASRRNLNFKPHWNFNATLARLLFGAA